MSSYDDPSSSKAPQWGEGSGGIFDAPDMVFDSPTTSERVVDTQSGFLVVVKRLDDRYTLSFKRRIGTPPTSSINLTPDESKRFARILNGNWFEENQISRIGGSLAPSTEEYLNIRARRAARQTKTIDNVKNLLKLALVFSGALGLFAGGCLFGYYAHDQVASHMVSPR
jgi:hypothetical protein